MTRAADTHPGRVHAAHVPAQVENAQAACELALCVSPYHLTTREVPAMLALTLGSSVMTLRPEPPAGGSREMVKAAVAEAPRFLRVLDQWTWCSDMWSAGVITAGMHVEGGWTRRLAEVYERIETQPGLAVLRGLTQQAGKRGRDEPIKALDTLCADLLRGGPDPGINLAVTAAMDEACASGRIAAVRGEACSVAQRAEMMLSDKLFTFAIPLLVRAGGGRVLTQRRDLRAELDELRRSVHAVLELARDGRRVSGESLARVTASARAYSAAYALWSELGATGDDENGQRVVGGLVRVTGVVLPADAALRAGKAAASAMVYGGSGGGGAGGGGGAPLASSDGAPLVALVVSEMKVRPG